MQKVFFASFLTLLISCTFISQAHAGTISSLEEAIKVTDSITVNILAKKVDSLQSDVSSLKDFVTTTKIPDANKSAMLEDITSMETFVQPTSTSSTPPPLVSFLDSTNNLYHSLIGYSYQTASSTVPKSVYELKYLAREIQIEVLNGKMKRVGFNIDDTIDEWAKIKENISDEALKTSVDGTISALQEGLKKQDNAGLYAKSNDLIALIPSLEAVNYQNKSNTSSASSFVSNIPQRTLLIGLTILVILGVALAYMLPRRKKSEHTDTNG